MTSSDIRLLICDILYTGMGLPQSPGAVVVSGGSVAATGQPDELRKNFPQAEETKVGGIIAPLPVNAHTHLDMSLYQFQALPYFRWIPEVAVAQREKRGLDGAKLGADILIHNKTVGVGDIVWTHDHNVIPHLLERENLSGVLYYEVLNPFPDQAEEVFAEARAKIEQWRKLEREGGPRVGLSPHASYTVSHKLLKLLSEYAADEDLPMQIHVAEHPSELELFRFQRGDLWNSLTKLNFPKDFAEVIGRAPEPELTPVRYLDELGVLKSKPTLVHMVNVTDEDIQRTAKAGCSVVTCPRSNHHLECGTFRWGDFAAAGVNIALGTDSVASGETLDIRDEVAFARQIHPKLDPRLIVRAAIKGGHRVLGSQAPFLRRGEAWREEYIW